MYNQICDVVKNLPYKFEIIFVDDGSKDKTLKIIGELAESDKRVKALSFSRNFGHQAALIAGLDYAAGDAVITMDGDLQHPPRMIPEMLKLWSEGNDLVLTIRKETEGVSNFKVKTAQWFYSLINRIGNVNIPPNTADFRLLSRCVVTELKNMEERALFLRGMVQWVGFKSAYLEYVAEPRFAGKTKYNYRAMLKLAADGITSFSNMPLHFALYFGFFVSGLSFLYGIYAIYMNIFTQITIPGWTSLLVAVLFLGGVQLITLGIIGLYVGKLFSEVKKRPRYIVKKTLGDLCK